MDSASDGITDRDESHGSRRLRWIEVFGAVDLNVLNTRILDLVARFAVSMNDADTAEFPTVLLGKCLRHRAVRIGREFLDILLGGPSVDTLGVVARFGEIVLIVEFGVDQLLRAPNY